MNLYLDSSAVVKLYVRERGYDAVQLASALTWRDALDSPLTFATWDRDLSTAADRAGLPPTDRLRLTPRPHLR